jgi:hypothetical protein
MILLASTQTEASKKNKIAAHRQRRIIEECQHFSNTVDSERMKHRRFGRASNELPKVKNLHERQVRSIDNKDISSFARYETSSIRNVSLGNSFRDTALSDGDSTSLENISQATLAASDIKPSVQKDSSDKVYLHVNGETKKIFTTSTSYSA